MDGPVCCLILLQWQLFQLLKDDQYVADSRKKWSKHCYGRAVNVTTVDLSGKIQAIAQHFR